MMNRGIHVRTIDDLLNMKLDTEIGKGKMDEIFPTILKNISKSDSELISQKCKHTTENVHKQLNS